jgi:16S rRNA processing protein RimM
VEFEGVTTPEEAVTMRGALLQVPQELPAQEGDAWYECDLIGMTVADEAGNELGCLEAIFDTPAHQVFVVRQAGREALIPAVKEFVKAVDVAQGRIIVRTIEGLVEA